MEIITSKQKIVLQVTKGLYAKSGEFPSVREIMEGCKKVGLYLKSTRSIFLYLNALEEKGLLKRGSGKGIGIFEKTASNFFDVPILGSTSAGAPAMLAEQYVEGYLKVSKAITRGMEVFAVQVNGDSMNLVEVDGKKIEDGDFILIDPEYKDYKDGDKLLVVIDGLATVKIYKRLDEDSIALNPKSTNSIHKPIILTPDDTFIINGRVIAVIKNPLATEQS